MKKYIKELEKIFEDANKSFLRKNATLFETRVSERTLCGALMIELHEVLKETKFSDYFVDVEYNRNIGGTLKTLKKTIRGLDEQIVTINCDLIVHSRGQNAMCDNLIALEMKKSTGRQVDKDNDRNIVIDKEEILSLNNTEDMVRMIKGKICELVVNG